MLPLPGSLRGGAATKVVAALLARGLSSPGSTAAHGMPAFGAQAEDGSWTTLVATDTGLDAIGIEPEAVPYAFNAGTNSAGEPAAGAPRAPTRRRSRRPRSAGAGRGRPRPRRATRALRARPATARSRRS